MNTVIIIRDSVLSAAAAVEVVLPIQDPHDDSSTDTPEDEDTLFDREEALRHDDAIMDFHWFNTIPWTDIKDIRSATSTAQVRVTTSATRKPASHHAPRALIPQLRTSMEAVMEASISKGKAAYAAMEAVTLARKWQEDAKRAYDQKFAERPPKLGKSTTTRSSAHLRRLKCSRNTSRP